MNKTIVIGAGASGIICALKLSENHEVILLEKNDKCGKKLLLTGNGHCNYWHDNLKWRCYYTDDDDNLKRYINEKNINDTYNFLCSLGIYPKIKNGYYYPYSNQAYSIREIFDKHLNNNKNIKVFYNTTVLDINYKNGLYEVITNNETFTCEKLVIACGSKASPKTGSDGFSYEVAKKFNIKTNPVLPALVGLKSDADFLKIWSGIRCEANVELYIDDEFDRSEGGEVQLTDYGISGICIFNLSSIISKNLNKKITLKINFMPFEMNVDDYFTNLNKTIFDTLESIISYKLINIILKKTKINGNAYYKSLTEDEKNKLKSSLHKFDLNIIGTNGFDKAQVCTGGISLKEISDTFETKKGLFFIGEALDVDGVCGGYNLAFAFISGYIAAQNIYK